MESASTPETTTFDAARLIENHQAGVWRYLRAMGCDTTLAEDITQETFLAVLKRPFHDYNQAATAAYLRRVAYNLFITVQRRGGHITAVENVEELDTSWDRWMGEDNGEDVLQALQNCLQGLTERARLALEMRFRDKESRTNIAAALEITDHGAKNLMQRAKQQLRQCIDEKIAKEK